MEKIYTGGKEASATSTSTSETPPNWIEIQDSLKKRLTKEDDFSWKLPIHRSQCINEVKQEEMFLKFVGGVDVSYAKQDPSIACGSLVVLDLHTLQVVYHDYSLVTLHVPYFPGFLAFREAPILVQLLEKMKNNDSPFYPQLLMVDGNGLLHPQGPIDRNPTVATYVNRGLASKKGLHHVDGLTQSGVRQLLQAKENSGDDFITLTGESGCIWGVAMRSTEGLLKPIFISIGHRVSLDTAIKIVKMTCKYRVPEPIRQADIRSRDYLRNYQMGILEQCNCLNLSKSK